MRDARNDKPELTCDLDQPVWGVIGFEGVIRNKITYREAVAITDESKNRGHFITTAEAIERAGTSGFRPALD